MWCHPPRALCRDWQVAFLLLRSDSLERRQHKVGTCPLPYLSPNQKLLTLFSVYSENAIGFYPTDTLIRGVPGWYNNSYGFHADEGTRYNCMSFTGSTLRTDLFVFSFHTSIEAVAFC